MWIATEKGLARFDGFDFVNYSRENSLDLPNDDVRELSQDSAGLLSLTTAEGEFRLNGGHFYPVSDSVAHHKAKELRTSDGTIWKYEGDTVIRANTRGLLSKWKVSVRGEINRVQSMLLDSRNTLWIGTRHGLYRFENDRLSRFNDLNDSVLCLYEDREGDVWVGTGSEGLHRLAPNSIGLVKEFANRGITTVAVSREGDLWAGTPEDGLLYLHGDRVKRITSQQGLHSDFVLSLAISQIGDVLMGSPNGLDRLRNERVISKLKLDDGFPDDFVRSILSDSEAIWIGTRHGLVKWSKGHSEVIDRVQGLPSDLVGSLVKTSKGELWVGTSHGVARLHENSMDIFLPKVAVTSLVEDMRGRLWLGTTSSGLYLWDHSGFRKVTAAYVPQTIFGLLEDTLGYLWIRTHSGLARVSLDTAAACAMQSSCDLSVRIFNTVDGLPSNDIFDLGDPGQARDREGNLYFATRRGLAKINPRDILSNVIASSPVVTNITIDNRNISREGEHPIVIDPHDSRITFSYVAPSLRQPTNIRYRYRLEGFDRDWVDAGGNRSVSFTNLPPERYRFWVMASNEDGVWSAPSGEMEIFVRPPVYRRWWFYLCSALAILALALFFYWLRGRKLQQQFEAVLSERSRIAREIHDTLAQDLAGVSVQLEVVSGLMARNPSQAAAQLEQTKAVVREGLTNARQTIWDLRATSDQKALPVRAKLVSEHGAGQPEIVQFEVGGAYRALPPQVEEELLRIMKEAVRNSARHSGRDTVAVSLQYRTDSLLMIIRDQGKGFDLDTAVRTGRFGLQGMRERAEAIGANITIESIAEEGTTVTVVVPG